MKSNSRIYSLLSQVSDCLVEQWGARPDVCKLLALAEGDPRRIMLCCQPDVVSLSGWFSDMMPVRMKVRCGTAVEKQPRDRSHSGGFTVREQLSKQFLSRIYFVSARAVDCTTGIASPVLEFRFFSSHWACWWALALGMYPVRTRPGYMLF
jgi:hypothetical protein